MSPFNRESYNNSRIVYNTVFCRLYNVVWNGRIDLSLLIQNFWIRRVHLKTIVIHFHATIRKKSVNSFFCCFLQMSLFNRKTSGDTLELVEESLDINLLNNAVRLKFQNCVLLPGGVHVSETQNHVIILILTSQTVHRLLLPHPSRMYRSVSWLSIMSFISQVTQSQI